MASSQIYLCLCISLSFSLDITQALNNDSKIGSFRVVAAPGDDNKAESNLVAAGLTKEEKAQQSIILKNTKDILKSNPFRNSAIVDYKDLTDDLETWEPPIELKRAFPYYHSGYDDEDRPIWISEFGKYNLKKIVEGGGEPLAQLDKYCSQGAYLILKSIKKYNTTDRPVHEGMFLVDMEGLEVSQFLSLPTVREVIRLAQKYQSLIANHIGISTLINTNYWGETFINIMRPLLGRTLERIEVYGTRKEKWWPVLRNRFPPETLPEWYGGTKNFKPVDVYGK